MATTTIQGIAPKINALNYLKALYAKSAIFLLRPDKGQSIWQKPEQHKRIRQLKDAFDLSA